MIVLVPIAFAAGVITVFTPCILPVLPIVLAGGAGTKRRPYAVAAGLVTTFTAFLLAGAWLWGLLGIGKQPGCRRELPTTRAGSAHGRRRADGRCCDRDLQRLGRKLADEGALIRELATECNRGQRPGQGEARRPERQQGTCEEIRCSARLSGDHGLDQHPAPPDARAARQSRPRRLLDVLLHQLPAHPPVLEEL